MNIIKKALARLELASTPFDIARAKATIKKHGAKFENLGTGLYAASFPFVGKVQPVLLWDGEWMCAAEDRDGNPAWIPAPGQGDRTIEIEKMYRICKLGSPKPMQALYKELSAT